MAVASRLLAVAFWLLTASVALHFILSPVYEEAVDVGQVWNLLNWPMAVASALALALHYHRKRSIDGGGDGAVDRQYLEANLLLYASVVLVLWFFWNWLDDLTVGAAAQSDNRLLMWAFINPLFVVISGLTGCYLWRCASS